MNQSQHDDALFELKRMSKLLALLATRDRKRNEQIKMLSDIDFQPKEIAELLGVTPNAVRVALHAIRKKSKKKTKSKKVSTQKKINDK